MPGNTRADNNLPLGAWRDGAGHGQVQVLVNGVVTFRPTNVSSDTARIELLDEGGS